MHDEEEPGRFDKCWIMCSEGGDCGLCCGRAQDYEMQNLGDTTEARELKECLVDTSVLENGKSSQKYMLLKHLIDSNKKEYWDIEKEKGADSKTSYHYDIR